MPSCPAGCLIVLRLSTIFNKYGGNHPPCLVPDFGGNALSFSPCCWLWASCKSPLCSDMSLVCPVSLKVLPWRDVGFCQRSFLYQLRWSCTTLVFETSFIFHWIWTSPISSRLVGTLVSDLPTFGVPGHTTELCFYMMDAGYPNAEPHACMTSTSFLTELSPLYPMLILVWWRWQPPLSAGRYPTGSLEWFSREVPKSLKVAFGFSFEFPCYCDISSRCHSRRWGWERSKSLDQSSSHTLWRE